jgi:dipeptidyl aminopeptidase/acylaminoacyl peptidase
VTARHITEVFYRSDGATYNPQEKWHIWAVDAATGEATQLTDGEFDEGDIAWSPDGRTITFVSNRHPNRTFELEADELYRIPAEGGEMEQLAAHTGSKHSPVYSPDGQWIAYLGTRLRPGQWWQNTCLYIVPAEGGEARNLTADHDVECSSHTSGDFGSPPPFSRPIWAADGQSLYVTIARHGGDHLGRVTLAGELSYVINDGFVNGAFSMDTAQSKVAYIHLEPTTTGQVWVREMASGAARQVTAVNQDILEAREFGQIEEVWFKGKEGNDLQGWIHTPPNFDPTQKYPSILEIHGGPQTQYGQTFMHEFHYLAAQGYVVYYCNPRGGQGYGEAHGSAISGRWGTVDYDDLMSWADLLASKPYIDTERMGVTGGSYGGYMTMMVIGQTNRFKAAASQRMVSNLISFHGTSDFNWGVKYLVGVEGEPWNNLEEYWRMSPMSLIGNVQTPTLVIHSENDLRCDKEQGEQVFVALKVRGIPTELVLFPEESHGLSRGGRTDRRVARLEHIARWMNQWVLG